MIHQQMNRFEWTLLLGLSVLWGGSFFLVEVALQSLPPLTLVLTRVSLAAIALWLFIMFSRLPIPKDFRVWVAFGIMGLLNNMLPFSLIAWGQQEISSGLASILNATTPLFAVVLAGFFLADERLTRQKLAGTIVGFTGIVLLIGPDVLTGLGTDVMAQCAVLCAAISYALAGIFGRRFRQMQVRPVVVAAGQLTMSSLLLFPAMLVVDGSGFLFERSSTIWLAMGALAIFSTALAYVLYFRLLESVGASNLLLVTFLIPISAIALGTAFLKETINPSEIGGMLLIGVGMSFIDGRLWSSRKADKLAVH